MKMNEAIEICERFVKTDGNHGSRLYEAIETLIEECQKYKEVENLIEICKEVEENGNKDK